MREGSFPTVPPRKVLHYCATCDDRDFAFATTIRECATFVAEKMAEEDPSLTRPEVRSWIQFPIPTTFRLDDGKEVDCGPLDVQSAGLFLEVLYFYYEWYTQERTVTRAYFIQ
jgi:hypothetical protein